MVQRDRRAGPREALVALPGRSCNSKLGLESHRASGSAWSKLGRNISIELALDPARRAPAQDFLSASRAEYDRLTEQSPSIDDAVIMNDDETDSESDEEPTTMYS